MVIGRKDGTATLPCSFSPSIRSPSSITISWMKGSPPNWSDVFRHPPHRPTAQSIPGNVNEGDRYELMGNLEQGDASISVRGLRQGDASDYSCHVSVRNSTLTTVTQDELKLQVVDGKNKTSLVIGKRSDSATLPCSFSPSIRNPSPITIRWMKGSPREESTVFNHSVNPPYNVPIKGGGRYELVGKLDQGEASIRVKELRLNDSSDYFCHVWVMNSTQETVTQDETKLEVVVPATILELLVESGNVTGEKTLVCRAEGKPPANITWIGPGNSTLHLNSSEMRVTHDSEKLLTVGELLHPRMPGKYTCVAVNEHQRDTREIHLFDEGKWLMQFLWFGLSILAIALLVMVFVLRSLKIAPEKVQIKSKLEDGDHTIAHSSVGVVLMPAWPMVGNHKDQSQF
ncbi:CD276 antigen homolog [Rhinoraja longicauda]